MSRKKYRRLPGTRPDKVSEFGKYFSRALALLKEATDEEALRMLGGGAANDFLQSLLTPWSKSGEGSAYKYLLANKRRAALIAGFRIAITRNYSAKVILDDGQHAVISPSDKIHRGEGVYFLQGLEPFEGLFAQYKDSQVGFAVAKRTIASGEQLDIESDLEFVASDVARESSRKLRGQEPDELTSALEQLHKMIESGESRESEYQVFLSAHPWVLGGEYSAIDRHTKLDDQNIPDFTAVKVRRDARDIVEIKPPTMKVFGKDGEFSTDFLRAWDQAERYLIFTRDNADYLRKEKNLVFENPKCWLVVGFFFSKEERRKIAKKEHLNPSITVLTYHDLLAYGHSTLKFLVALQGRAKQDEEKS